MFKNDETLPDVRDDPNHPEAQAHHDQNLHHQQQLNPEGNQQEHEHNQGNDLPPPEVTQQPQGQDDLPDPHEHAPGMTHEVHDQLGQDYCLANGECTRDQQTQLDQQAQLHVSDRLNGT